MKTIPKVIEEGAKVVRCNDVYFPMRNESGKYYEPLYKATMGTLKGWGKSPSSAIRDLMDNARERYHE